MRSLETRGLGLLLVLGLLAGCDAYRVKCADHTECAYANQLCVDGACQDPPNSDLGGGSSGGGSSGSGSSGSGSSGPNPATNHPWLTDAVVAPDAVSQDLFGAALAWADEYTLVGAPARDGTGRVYVYGRYGNPTVVESPSPVNGGRFGASVAVYLSLLAVGAPGEGTLEEGRVHLFEVDSEVVVTHLATLACASECRGDKLGTSVSLDSYATDARTFLAAGAPGHGTPEPGSGRVLLWRMAPEDKTQWIPNTPLLSPTPSLQGGFGTSLCLNVHEYDRHWLAVGAPKENTGGAAHVFIHEAVETTWPLQQTLTPPMPEAGDAFGHAVSLDIPFLLVGSPGRTVLGNATAGAAYLFQRDVTDFVLDLTLLAPAPAPQQRAGFSVSLGSRGLALVGAPGSAEDRMDRGSVFVWEDPVDGNPFTFVRADFGSPTADDFGYAVSAAYTNYAASAPMEGMPGLSGAVLRFDNP